jgi:hypothetical protein
VPGGFTITGVAGANSFHFMGRLGGKSLKPGSYVLSAIAAANGLSSKPATHPFKIVG